MKNAPVLFSDININRITVPPRRLRGLRPDVVESLVESIAKRGLLQPIRVQMKGGGGYELVAGLHRLEAVRKLGYATIAAGVVKGLDADQALLEEIDENLVRAELSPAERVYHLSERKRLYEKLYPETRHGGDRRSVSSSQNENLKAFAADTATKTGKGRSSIARDVARAGKIAVLPDIVGTSLDKGVEIDALATLPEDEQRALAERAKAGEQVTARSPLQKATHEISFNVFMAAIRRFPDDLEVPPKLTDREKRRALNDVRKGFEALRRIETKLIPAPTEDETVDQITTLFKGLSRQKQGPCVRKLHKIATGAI